MSKERANSLYPASMLTRRSKVGIVGAGFVGTALAYACQIKGAAREIALFDINRAKVEAEALDLAHGIQFTPAASISGSDDVEAPRLRRHRDYRRSPAKTWTVTPGYGAGNGEHHELDPA